MEASQLLEGDRLVAEVVLKTQEWGGSTVGGRMGVRRRSGGRAVGGAHLAQPRFFLAKSVFKLDISEL